MEANQKQHSGNSRYILMLLLMCAVLVFGIFLVFRHETDDTPDAEASLTETTEPTASSQSPTETTDEAVSVSASASGNLQRETSHIYIRVNHTKVVPIHLNGSITKADIVWSTDSEELVDISDGMLTGLMPGECTITAKVGTEELKIPVTVRELCVIDGCTYVDGILVANKSYSLPHDYDPGTLPVTEEAFAALSAAAAEEGLNIYEGSAYRNYDFQVTVYNSMVNGYSKEYADAYSARPGHSEHQTGYTIDCNTIDVPFGETEAGQWLAVHCHEYGFIIRYPEGKEDITGYAYEPWHIRYVGKIHAKAIYKQHLTLEEYLDIESVYPPEEEDAENATP